MTTYCPTHNRPLMTEHTSRKKFCLACRNEHKVDFYFTNPYPVFGKGKPRRQAQRETYERQKAERRADGVRVGKGRRGKK